MKDVQVTIKNVGKGPVTVHPGGVLHKGDSAPPAIELLTPGDSKLFETAAAYMPYQVACQGLKGAEVLEITVVEAGEAPSGDQAAPAAPVATGDQTPAPAATATGEATPAAEAPTQEVANPRAGKRK